MSKRTHYEVLGVAPDAAPAALRKAYLRLARELHPDRNHAPTAAARFAEAASAYNVLADPKRRALYDAQLALGLSEPPPTRLPRSIVDPAEELVLNTLDATAIALAASVDGLAARSGLLGKLVTGAMRGAARSLRERAESGASELAERLRGRPR